MADSNALSWDRLFDVLEHEPTGTIVRLPKYNLPHPLDAGAAYSVGLPVGQSADFRWHFPDGAGLCARDFGTHYEVHIAPSMPSIACPHGRSTELDSAAAIGGLMGMLVGRCREATVAGIALGAILAASARQTKEPK